MSSDILSGIAYGFGVAMTPLNLLFCLAGVTLGTFVGVLPGIGPILTIAVLLPVTFNVPPEASLIMLAGIYYGAQYGGSITSILMKLPGESSALVSTFDGHPMARQGRAGPALSISALASFAAGTITTLLIAIFGPVLAGVALSFGPAEYFSLMLLGLMSAVSLSDSPWLRAFAMLLLGIFLGLIGTDVNTGVERFTFDFDPLRGGIDFAILVVGLFGIGETIANLRYHAGPGGPLHTVGRLMPSKDDLRASILPVLRGTGIGTIIGVLPGGGATLATFASYGVERKISRTPERFGKGAVEGLAGPEASNNAAAQAAFVPLLTLGVPGSPTTAIMMGAIMIHGINPGPQLMVQNPELFWGVIASMWVGNLMLVILNLPLVGIWVRFLQIPFRWLYPAILLFCSIGVYSIANSGTDVVMAAAFGILGYAIIRLDCDPAPLLLGFLLGPTMEEMLRRSLLLSRGDPIVLLERPISLAFLIATVAVIFGMALGRKRLVSLKSP